MPRGLDHVSVCDEVGVRMCCKCSSLIRASLLQPCKLLSSLFSYNATEQLRRNIIFIYFFTIQKKTQNIMWWSRQLWKQRATRWQINRFYWSHISQATAKEWWAVLNGGTGQDNSKRKIQLFAHCDGSIDAGYHSLDHHSGQKGCCHSSPWI